MYVAIILCISLTSLTYDVLDAQPVLSEPVSDIRVHECNTNAACMQQTNTAAHVYVFVHTHIHVGTHTVS